MSEKNKLGRNQRALIGYMQKHGEILVTKGQGFGLPFDFSARQVLRSCERRGLIEKTGEGLFDDVPDPQGFRLTAEGAAVSP